MQGISLLGPLLQREITVFVLKKHHLLNKKSLFVAEMVKKALLWMCTPHKVKVLVHFSLGCGIGGWEKESSCTSNG